MQNNRRKPKLALIVGGVEYDIDWRSFKIGQSVFLPCLNPDKMEEVLRKEAAVRDCRLSVKHVIENGVQGIRAWRLG